MAAINEHDRSRKQTPVWRRLRVERLEDRQLLAVVSVHWGMDGFARPVEVRIGLPEPLAAVLERFADVEENRLTGGALEAMRQPSVFDEPATTSKSIVAEPADLRYRAGAVADAFLAQYGRSFGLSEPLEELVPVEVEADQIGMTHVKYQQQYHGVTVYGTGLNVHLRTDGSVDTASGRLVSDVALDAVPRVSAADAIRHAQTLFAQQFAVPEGAAAQVVSTTLYVWNGELIDNEAPRPSQLVWEIFLSLDGTLANEQYYIDAHSGDLVFQVTANRYLNREVYDVQWINDWDYYWRLDYYEPSLRYTFGRSEGQPPRGENPQYLMPWTNPYEVVNPYEDPAIVDTVYDMLEQVHESLFVTFGRNGANGQGGTGPGNTVTTVWVGDRTFSGSAYLQPSGRVMDFGTIFVGGNVDLNMLAHEYGHLVNNERNLVYSNESGAIEECFADCISESCELYASGYFDWVFMGEWPGRRGRSLKSPHELNCSGRSLPDRYRDPLFYLGSDDLGGIHGNTTVVSKATYLISEGGSHNGFEIRSLGIDKLQQIWWRTYMQYLVPSETFNSAYGNFIQAARDLYGDTDADEVRKALQAVEMHLPRRDQPMPTVVDEVTVSGAPVNAISIQFNAEVDVTAMLAVAGRRRLHCHGRQPG
jgi:bacillolysin